jgi:hypothetical protein
MIVLRYTVIFNQVHFIVQSLKMALKGRNMQSHINNRIVYTGEIVVTKVLIIISATHLGILDSNLTIGFYSYAYCRKN